MGQAEQNLPPVEDIFNPHSEEYMLNPVPQCLAMKERGALVWYEPWQAWIMTQMSDILECWKQSHSPPTSTIGNSHRSARPVTSGATLNGP